MFTLETPLWEILLRGTAIYLAIAVLMRVIPKRQSGNLSPNDVLALVIIGDLAGHGMAGESKSALELLLLIAVVAGWDYGINLLEYYFPRFRRVAQDSPTLLIHKGRVIKRNLAREKLTEQELDAALRKQGVDDVARVKQAILEVDGEITVIQDTAT